MAQNGSVPTTRERKIRTARTARVLGPVVALLTVLSLSRCGDTVDDAALASAISHHQPAEVTVQGPVTELLPDNTGSDGDHQRFRCDFHAGVPVEIDHNLALAPRVPVRVGDSLIVHGQFEPDPGHPVIHYTHHATGRHEGGWIELNGQHYE